MKITTKDQIIYGDRFWSKRPISNIKFSKTRGTILSTQTHMLRILWNILLDYVPATGFISVKPVFHRWLASCHLMLVITGIVLLMYTVKIKNKDTIRMDPASAGTDVKKYHWVSYRVLNFNFNFWKVARIFIFAQQIVFFNDLWFAIR